MLDLFPMETSLLHFANTSPDTEASWRGLKKLKLPSYLNETRPDTLTPYFKFPFFDLLSGDQKQRLYVAFTQFNAEVLIMLELVLYEGMKVVLTDSFDPVVTQAVKKMRHEEKLHTKGFITFLKKETPLFPKTSFMLRNNSWLKNAFLKLVRWNPLSLALPAAKVEAFSVYYGKCVRSQYKTNNLWVEVNYLHLIDEAHHVNFEFDLFKHMTSKSGPIEKLKIITGNFLFILLLQITFLIGCHRMVKYSLPNLKHLEHIKKVLLLGKWILYKFEPYAQTRELIKNHFISRTFFAKSLFQFMHR